jgi:hypothetical protein
MEFQVLLMALGLMFAFFIIGGLAYGIYHWVTRRPRE